VLRIECPWCGPRDELEFHCGGESSRQRPGPAHTVTDARWADYLFVRENRKGLAREAWLHEHGCRQWFIVVRHTVTHEIQATGPFTDPPTQAPR
jgi:sarcosine oxidase, subunit delta